MPNNLLKKATETHKRGLVGAQKRAVRRGAPPRLPVRRRSPVRAATQAVEPRLDPELEVAPAADTEAALAAAGGAEPLLDQIDMTDMTDDGENIEYIHEALAAGQGEESDTEFAGRPPEAAVEVEAEVEADAVADAEEIADEPESEPAPERVATRSSSSDATSFLAMYFREMAALDVLRPEEEFQAARHIESLEIAVWEQIFSFAPVADHVLKVVEACMDNSIAEFRALRRSAAESKRVPVKGGDRRMAKVARKASERLRVLDVDKQYLQAVLTELAKIERGHLGRIVPEQLSFSPKTQTFINYLRRVAHSDTAAAGARNEFVKANLRLVVSIARRFNHGRMALADLIQEGNIGLMKAVERYDYRRGFRFSTYASWWIRHAISRALADKGREVRLPVHMIDAYHRISKAKRELTAKLGRQPTSEEVAEATSIAAAKIEKMRTYLLDQSFSLDRPVSEEDGRHFIEFLQDPNLEDASPVEELADQTMTEEVRRLLSDLKPIEADILRQRFGLDDDRELTLKEIGEKYNLSRERIRQLQEQALGKMRRALQRKDLI